MLRTVQPLGHVSCFPSLKHPSKMELISLYDKGNLKNTKQHITKMTVICRNSCLL